MSSLLGHFQRIWPLSALAVHWPCHKTSGFEGCSLSYPQLDSVSLFRLFSRRLKTAITTQAFSVFVLRIAAELPTMLTTVLTVLYSTSKLLTHLYRVSHISRLCSISSPHSPTVSSSCSVRRIYPASPLGGLNVMPYFLSFNTPILTNQCVYNARFTLPPLYSWWLFCVVMYILLGNYLL